MKKALLFIATVLCALSANAQGISAVGANVQILPSVKWDKQAYDAWTYVINSGTRFDTGGSNTSDKNEDGTYVNSNYNVLCGDEPADDSNGKHWTEVGYNPEDEATIGENQFGEYTGTNENGEVTWEQHTAPFSSDEKYNDLPSYQWTTGEIMADIYFRRTFTTTSVLPNDVYLACGHDDAPAEFYINGELVYSVTDGWNESEYYKLTDEQKALIHKDGTENVIAVHVHQNWGGAFADCGLYTSVPGGVDMGYVTGWTGKTLFNSLGGYQNDTSGNPSGYHKWEKLYDAQAGDVYEVKLKHSTTDEWQNQVHFKTPIRISPDKTYTFKCNLNSVIYYDQVTVKLTDNDYDDINGNTSEVYSIDPGTATPVELTLTGAEFNNLKVVYDFCWADVAEDGDYTVNISDMSLTDEDGNELFVGSSFFNYFYCCNENGDQVATPIVNGRNETLSWTQIDFDDAQWDDTDMPIGSQNYGGGMEVSHWPSHYTTDVITRDGVEYNYMDYFYDDDHGKNTNYWIRRTFEIDQVNPSLEYLLNICHDDNCDAYVNGHFLKHWDNWTDGKNPEEVHIKASYLQPGKNVIAVYIQQNWGGRFYDCGINVKEFNYEEVKTNATDAIAKAEAFDGDLTEAMKAEYDSIIAAGKEYLATELDGAEVRNYFNGEFATAIKTIQDYSATVTMGRQMLAATKNQQGINGEIAEYRPSESDFETLATADAINNAFNNLKIARKRTAAERHTEEYVGSPVGDGDFYIYNVGEKQFLGAGENWGTHLALEYASNAMTLTYYDEEPTYDDEGTQTGTNPAGYVIETYRPNGDLGVNDFMNIGGYIDTSNQDRWTFVPVEGKTNVYNIVRYGDNGKYGKYLGWRGAKNPQYDATIEAAADTLSTNTFDHQYSNKYDNQNGYSYNVIDTDMRSGSIESNQWMLIKKEEMDQLATTATADKPVDMTHLISNPGFDQRLTTEAWEGVNIWGRGDNHSDFVHENWNSDIALNQEITDDAIIPGWYTLACQGYYRDGTKENHNAILEAGETPNQYASLYVGDEEILVRRIDDNDIVVPYTLNSTQVYNGVRCPDYPTDAAEAFEHGAYWNIVKFEVADGDEGEIFFGLESSDPDEAYGRWTVVDNFRLVYWGTTEPTDEQINAVGIQEVSAPIATSVKGIYNLNGQKLQKAVKGVNIINGKKYVVK